MVVWWLRKRILLCEDDEIDAEAVRRAFKRKRIANPIGHVQNGEEALARLRGTEQQPALERPYLILLDLNMPRMGGIEFLQELRADPVLKDSLVFVLTTSSWDHDIVEAYNQNVAGYLLKSKVGDDFMHFLEMIDHHWRVVEFPPPK